MSDSARPLVPDPRWTGVLLTGGLSSRMGQDKLQMRLPNGELLVERPAGALASVCGTCCSVRRAQAPAFVPEGFEDLLDVEPGGGPLAGVVSAVQHARTPWVLVVGGDMPALDGGFLRAFMDLAEREPHFALMVGGRRLEPLPLALPMALANEVIQRFQLGERTLRRAVPASRLRLAEPHQLPVHGERAPWLSLNTPEEWRHFAGQEIGTSV